MIINIISLIFSATAILISLIQPIVQYENMTIKKFENKKIEELDKLREIINDRSRGQSKNFVTCYRMIDKRDDLLVTINELKLYDFKFCNKGNELKEFFRDLKNLYNNIYSKPVNARTNKFIIDEINKFFKKYNYEII